MLVNETKNNTTNDSMKLSYEGPSLKTFCKIVRSNDID